MWEYIVLLVILFVWKLSFKKKGEWIETPWSLSAAKAIQGISAIGIILHHCTQKLENAQLDPGALAPFRDFGVLFVGIFLFFSGYGLIKSYQSKPDYFKHFLRNRLLTLLIPFFVCNFVYYIFVTILGRRLDLLLSIIGYPPINDQIWFVIELVIFYLVFYLLYRFIKNDKLAMAGMFVFIIAFIGYCLTRGHGYHWFQGEWWYNSSLLFVIGIAFGTFETSIIKFIKKTYVILLPVILIATYVFYRLNVYFLETRSYWSETPGNPAYGDKLTCLSAQVVMIVCFVFSILLIMMKVKIGNPALTFLGKRSLEIYLLQNLFLTYLRSGNTITIKNDDLYVAAVISGTVLAAFLVHLVDSFIVSKIRKK